MTSEPLPAVLTRLREFANLTRAAVANAAGLETRDLLAYERGESQLDGGRLFELARFLRLAVEHRLVELKVKRETERVKLAADLERRRRARHALAEKRQRAKRRRADAQRAAANRARRAAEPAAGVTQEPAAEPAAAEGSVSASL